MTRKECLDKAAECVLRDRNREYGEPERSFSYIADLWSAYLRTKIEPYDAAAMMALFKLARLRFNPYYEDGWADLAGYAACGAELAGRAEAYRQSIEAAGEEYKKLRAEAEAQPEFKPGDKVQFKEHLGVKGWADARYEREHPSGYGHIVYAEGFGRIAVEPENLRPAPKAEGCEELEQKDAPLCGERCEEFIPGLGTCEGCHHAREHDAPQTPQELYKRIVANNPATYGTPHKPTGEELAEMAEEEWHG